MSISREKEEFIEAEVSSPSEDDTDSDIETVCKVVRGSSHKKNRGNTSQELLQQVIAQHTELGRVQKKMYSIKAELSKQEISNRYLKLEMGTDKVRITELREKLGIYKKTLFNANVENYVFRVIFILYVMRVIYNMLNMS
jgi:glutamate synthase domain-containing protein 1